MNASQQKSLFGDIASMISSVLTALLTIVVIVDVLEGFSPGWSLTASACAFVLALTFALALAGNAAVYTSGRRTRAEGLRLSIGSLVVSLIYFCVYLFH